MQLWRLNYATTQPNHQLPAEAALEEHKDTLHFVPGALEIQQDPPRLRLGGRQAGGQARGAGLANSVR